jgi:hypothetical protein
MPKSRRPPKVLSDLRPRKAHIEVLLLAEPDGTWLAMPETDADMRADRGASIETTQEAVRHQYANPLPLRFPIDFPFMPREFKAQKREGKLLGKEQHFTWYVLSVGDRHEAVRNQLREATESLGRPEER